MKMQTFAIMLGVLLAACGGSNEGDTGASTSGSSSDRSTLSTKSGSGAGACGFAGGFAAVGVGWTEAAPAAGGLAWTGGTAGTGAGTGVGAGSGTRSAGGRLSMRLCR